MMSDEELEAVVAGKAQPPRVEKPESPLVIAPAASASPSPKCSNGVCRV